MALPSVSAIFPVRDYDLAATLSSGQAFRWQFIQGAWHGVIGPHWVRLRANPSSIDAELGGPVTEWNWLRHYLQLDLDFNAVLSSFPDDAPMRAAINACRGLRLLRQDPWECLASFILSSTKQIVQIRQIISLLCARFGEPIADAAPDGSLFAFPTPGRLAGATEPDLRSCKMGFRAPYLLEVARAVAGGDFDLNALEGFPVECARAELMRLPGVGRKIADCVLLFAYGHQSAFPVDVWVMKALRRLYFPRRRPALRRLHSFSAEHFGPHAGYAQQYLFHYMRTQSTSKGLAL